MRLLLDTHILLWWFEASPKLPRAARAQIEGADIVYVSAASAWEMAIKSTLRKLRVPDDLAAQLQAHRFEELPVSIEHATMVARLPLHHRDPFDRLLIAQASLESLVLLTADPQLASYGAPAVLV